MLAFHWALFGIALFVALTHGALITSAVGEGNLEYLDEAPRSKRSYKRGQTQSQYLNFGQPELDGKAEAEATENGSRSTVSGTHGMGQAQSQFSSGDCSGCNVGSPVYEYSTGSPDPLTLGGNAISYSDSKPFSTLRLPGTTSGRASAPGGQIDGAFNSGVAVQGSRPGIVGDLGQASGGTFAPVTGGQIAGPDVQHTPGIGSVPLQSGSNSGFLPPVDLKTASRNGGAFAPGMSTVSGQLAQPELSNGFAVGPAEVPQTSHTLSPGHFEQPVLSRNFATGRRIAEEPAGVNDVQGQPRTSSGFVPGRGFSGVPRTSSLPSGVDAIPRQLGQLDINSGFGPDSIGASRNFPSDIAEAPEIRNTFTPRSENAGQIGLPGPGKSDIGQQGPRQYPQLIASPAGQVQGQHPQMALRPQVHNTYTGSGSFTQPEAGKQQVPQYKADGYQGQAYWPDSRRPADVPILTGKQVQPHGPSILQLAQPGTFYKPGSSFPTGQKQVPQYITDPQVVPSYGQPTAGSVQPGSSFPTGQKQVPQYITDPQVVPSYGQPTAGSVQPDSSFPTGQEQVPQYITDPQAVPSYGQPTGGSVQPGSSFPTGQEQVPQYITDPQVVPSYGQPTAGSVQPGPQQILQQTGAGIRPGVAGFRQNTDGNPGQTANFGTGSGIRPQPGSVLQSVYRTQPNIDYGQSGRNITPGIESSYQQNPEVHQGHIPPSAGFGKPDVRVHQGHAPGTGYGQPDSTGQQRSFQPSDGLVKPGTGVHAGFGRFSPKAEPRGVSNAQTDARHFQPGVGMPTGITYEQEGAALPPERTYGYASNAAGTAQQGLITRPIQEHIGVGYHHGLEAFDPQSDKAGTRTPQASSSTQEISGSIPGFPPPGRSAQLRPGSGFEQQPQKGQKDEYTQGMLYGPVSSPTLDTIHPSQRFQQTGQPNAGMQSGLRFDQTQPGVQSNTHRGSGFVQHPSAGPSLLLVPAGGLQQDSHVQRGTSVQQGTSTQQAIGIQPGSTYDTIYSEPPGSQAVVGYRQPNPATQDGQPNYVTQGAGLQPGFRQPETTQHGQGSPNTQYSHGPQQLVQTGSTYNPAIAQRGIAESGGLASGTGGIDDAFSQAESSIGNGQAAASAQGKKNGGTAKTQVQGTYSLSGSFSASAMTSDNDRSASSQVTGGVEGAMSQSQGQGGAAQSQAQVQVNEKSGGTKASSQSGGIIHQSQSEVQSNDKGGVADAQSSGPGQTSSQAQIGFRPGQDGEIVRSAGGGQASAQSGAHSGNSQSQIQGTSKYGVSYHGAAQSASGTKEQVATYREQNRDLFNTISQFGSTDAVTDRVEAIYNPALTSEAEIPDVQLKAARTNKEAANSDKVDDNSIAPDEEEEEEPYDEYDDEEDYYNENPIKMESKTTSDKKLETSSLYRTHTQASPTQIQQVAVANPTKKYNVVQNQNGRTQKYHTRTTTETVPSGFRGTVNVEKKFHTKSLEPHKSENKLNTNAGEKSGNSPRTPNSFVTVTKSITGSMDNSKNPPQENKNFQSTFYTKSSTCGYFTFSCNIVYGANGRSKICRPKAPANGKC